VADQFGRPDPLLDGAAARLDAAGHHDCQVGTTACRASRHGRNPVPGAWWVASR
jgi:hypothetical protein